MHPAPTMLSRYLDGDLAAEQRDAVEDHVRGCLSCRRLLQSLSQTISGLSTLIVHAPSHVTEGIVAALSSASGDSAPQLTVVASDRAQSRADLWHWLRVAVRYCLQRSQLRITVPTGVLLGIVLSLVNMGGKVLPGEFDLRTCAVCAADFLLPFVAINVVLLAATWRTRGR